MTHCSFSTVRERDMDLLFLESIVSDPDFAKLVLSNTCYAGKEFKIVDAALSRTELYLGESDITVILEIDGQRVALLIEDKIDAIAMPDQHKRYQLRGEKGREHCEWHAYEIFIFARRNTLSIIPKQNTMNISYPMKNAKSTLTASLVL